MPSSAALALPDRHKPYVMAHRGNRVAFPENTLSAFRQAILDGADILETDLHLSRDEIFICIHDSTVDRTTDGMGAVAEMTLAELKRLDAAAGRRDHGPEPIPTLEELAALIPPDRALALELKSDRFLEPDVNRRLADLLERYALLDRTIVLSFSRERLRAVRASTPEIPLGWITMTQPWPVSGVEMIGPFWPLMFVNPLYAFWAHANGQLLCPLDPQPEPRLWYYRLVACDAVLSDNPALACRALGKAEAA
jgi:glycerophosphoryl diester phosphodiesterase